MEIMDIIFSATSSIDKLSESTMIDPSGGFVREVGGGTYMAGGHADVAPAVGFEEFTMDHGLWVEKILTRQ